MVQSWAHTQHDMTGKWIKLPVDVRAFAMSTSGIFTVSPKDSQSHVVCNTKRQVGLSETLASREITTTPFTTRRAKAASAGRSSTIRTSHAG